MYLFQGSNSVLPEVISDMNTGRRLVGQIDQRLNIAVGKLHAGKARNKNDPTSMVENNLNLPGQRHVLMTRG